MPSKIPRDELEGPNRKSPGHCGVIIDLLHVYIPSPSWCWAWVTYITPLFIPTIRLGITWLIIILRPSQFNTSQRWHSLTGSLFLPLWLSSLCIGWMANVEDEIFLQVQKSTLWLETFFRCPAHLNGRRLRSGEKNTVRDGSRLRFSPQNSSFALRRFRYYSCQRFRDIDDYFKLVRSRYRPSRPTIQYLFQ